MKRRYLKGVFEQIKGTINGKTSKTVIGNHCNPVLKDGEGG